MGEELLVSCDSQEEWDELLEKNILVVVCFITFNSPSTELIQTMKGLAAECSTVKECNTVKFLQVDVNNFKPKHEDFKVTEVPSVMFVNNGERKFPKFSDLNALKLKKKIMDLPGEEVGVSQSK